MDKEKKLQVKDLTISFRTVNGKLQAVRDISFDLYKGETLAIVGESGSGKSATSKTILGISAGNTIIEGGEILYDGKDLLKISEEDFHAIRGDKIAMVFQDPLSSLNPIMRVGKQLTEAMLLKNKANRRESKRKLAQYLKSLDENMKAAGCANDSSRFATFRKIMHTQSRFEAPYDQAHSNAVAAAKAAADLLLAIEKENTDSLVSDCRELKNYCDNSLNKYVVRNASAMKAASGRLNSLAKKTVKNRNFTELKSAVFDIEQLLKDALTEEQPDFFALGCYIVLDGGRIGNESAAELNNKTQVSARSSFIADFTAATRQAIEYSSGVAHEAGLKAVAVLGSGYSALKDAMPDKKAALKLCEELINATEAAIDPLETVKDSAAYTFRVSLTSAIEQYYDDVERNKKEQKRFDKQQARYEQRLQRGKAVNGKVAPLALVDLENAHEGVLHIIDNMKSQFEAVAEKYSSIDYEARTEAFMEWLRATAMAEVHKITKSMAKDTAIRIMEQVGITEARKRYRQYPFEFSGGMRQRIVIAISLTADPDILICDEPTTALDVTIQAQILDLINDLKRQRNLSVIFITHDLGVVAHMADRIAVMYAGKIVEYGTAEDVFYHPAHPYTWALLSSIPDLNSKEKLEAIPGTPPNMIYPPKGDAFAARNKYAMEIDFEEQPPMFKISDSHYAATWLLHPDAPKVEMPEIVKARIERMKKEGGAVNV